VRAAGLFGWFVLVVALSLSACGSFSGSDAPSNDTSDGGDASAPTGIDGGGPPKDASEGPPAPCAPAGGTAFLTADFEESPARFYVLGTPAGLTTPLAPDAFTVDTTAATCGSHSLAVAYKNNGFSFGATQDAPFTVKKVTATLDLRFDDLSATVSDETVVAIGVRSPAFDHCYVALQVLNPGEKQLGIQSHCGQADSNKYKGSLITNPVGLGWLHVTFVLDLPNQNASLSINGGAAQSMGLAASDVTVGGPTVYAEVGITSPKATVGASVVRFDNVRVAVE